MISGGNDHLIKLRVSGHIFGGNLLFFGGNYHFYGPIFTSEMDLPFEGANSLMKKGLFVKYRVIFLTGPPP